MTSSKAKYVVRSPEGELRFESFAQVQKAYVSGLVAPEDEIREADGTKWRRASSIPELDRAARLSRTDRPGSQSGWLFLSLFIASVALYLVVQGLHQRAYGKLGVGLLLSFALSGLLFRVLRSQYRRP